MTYDDLIDSRVRNLMESWPTLDTAFGCLDCRIIVRSLDTTAVVSDGPGKCPGCGSESVYDVAAALALERAVVSVERLRTIVEMLEAVDL